MWSVHVRIVIYFKVISKFSLVIAFSNAECWSSSKNTGLIAILLGNKVCWDGLWPASSTYILLSLLTAKSLQGLIKYPTIWIDRIKFHLTWVLNCAFRLIQQLPDARAAREARAAAHWLSSGFKSSNTSAAWMPLYECQRPSPDLFNSVPPALEEQPLTGI